MDGSRQEGNGLSPELEARREAALASIRAKRTRREAGGYAVMAGLMSLEPATRGEGPMARIVHYCKLFLIAFALLVPNYLVWRLLL